MAVGCTSFAEDTNVRHPISVVPDRPQGGTKRMIFTTSILATADRHSDRLRTEPGG